MFILLLQRPRSCSIYGEDRPVWRSGPRFREWPMLQKIPRQWQVAGEIVDVLLAILCHLNVLLLPMCQIGMQSGKDSAKRDVPPPGKSAHLFPCWST